MLSLKPFQLTGIDFILQRNGRALLADEAGLGKTATTIHAAMKLNNFPILIFSIKPGLYVWQDELAYWLQKESVIYIGNPKQREESWKQFELAKDKILITNYFFIEEVLNRTNSSYWRTIIADEYHAMGLSNHKTDRYKAVLPMVKNADNVILVTGSPMRRNLGDLFAPFRLLDPKIFTSYWKYVYKYGIVIEETFGKTIEAMPKNPKEFIKLRNKYLLRRLAKDHLPELPDKVRQPISVWMTPKQEKLFKQMKELNYAEEGNKFVIAQNPAVRVLRERQLLVTPKIFGFDEYGGALEMMVELIKTEFESKHAVSVFTPFREAVKYIKQIIEEQIGDVKFFHLHGGMTAKQITDNEKGFQNLNTHRKVFLGVIKSGMAITITEAKVMIFVGYEWTSEENEQAEKRIHRIGQKDFVRALYLLYRDNDTDERVRKILNTKDLNKKWALQTEDFL